MPHTSVLFFSFVKNIYNLIIAKIMDINTFLEKRNKSSYINQMAMSLWLKSMNKEETILMVEALF